MSKAISFEKVRAARDRAAAIEASIKKINIHKELLEESLSKFSDRLKYTVVDNETSALLFSLGEVLQSKRAIYIYERELAALKSGMPQP